MRRRLASIAFWSIAACCALGTAAWAVPDGARAQSTKTRTCQSQWGPHLGQCSCTCSVAGYGTLWTYRMYGRAFKSGTSTGYTNLLSHTGPAPADPTGISWYDGAQTRTRVNCTDTDINWAQIDSSWGARVWSPQSTNSQSWCPGEAPIAYETFCQVKGYCSAYTGL